MKRSTAIVAAVLAVIVVVAAIAGALLLSNQGGDSGGNGGNVPDDGIPSGPEGSVNGAVINVALNQSNASAYDELLAIFNSFADSVEDPDALVQIAVSNNMTEDVELNLANFTATTEDGQVQALNTNVVTIEPNTTAYMVLGFQAEGNNITAVAYGGDDIELSEMSVQSAIDRELAPPVMMEAPTNLTEISNLTFEALSTWRIAQGDLSPMPLFFNESENVILALVAGQNNNTTAMTLSPESFWLDLGNGTWVQAEETKNHNLPDAIEPDTTEVFLIGFRVNQSANPSAIHFWPDQSTNATVMFTVMPQQAPDQPGNLAVSKVWMGQSNNTTGNTLFVELVNLDGGEEVELSGWSVMEGAVTAEVANATGGREINGTVYAFELDDGDRITVLQYEEDGQTRFLWLRPLVAP